jgi:hypothetical protein
MKSFLQQLYYGELLETQHGQAASGEVSRQLTSVSVAEAVQTYLRLTHGDAEVIAALGEGDDAQNHCRFLHGC